jgi:gliding motility-associated-like protein
MSAQILAQESNYWNFSGNNSNYLLNFNHEPPIIQRINATGYPTNSLHRYENRMAYSDLSGQLVFYSNNDTILTTTLNPKYVGIQTNYGRSGIYCKTNAPNIVEFFYWHRQLGFSAENDTNIIYTLTQVKADIVKGIKMTENKVGDRFKQVYFRNPWTDGTQILNCKYYPKLNVYWIVGGTSDSLFFIRYRPESGIDTSFFIPNPATYNANSRIVFNHQGTAIAFASLNKFDSIGEPPEFPVDWGYGGLGNNRLDILAFDPNLGDVSIKRNLQYSTKVHHPNPVEYFYYTSVFGIEFSPNDSLLYALVLDQGFRNNQLWQFNVYPGAGEQNVYRLPYPKAQSPFVIVDDQHPISKDIKLGPNGRIYLNSFKTRLNTLSFIEYPDKKGKDCNIVYDGVQNPWGTSPDDLSSNYHFGYTHDHYKPVKFRHSSPCSGQFTQFENLTDSQNFVRYRFYFGDGDSCELDESFNLSIPGGRNVALSNVWGVGHQYTLPGQYFVKLKAINEVGGFVWYSDSITIHPPPVAGFTVSDTAGCQWIAHHFNNTSSFKPRFSGPPPVAYAYHWQFGNGLDTSMSFAAMPTAAQGSVSHSYSQNGLYRVSLVANDGLCTDTFTLNQQVNILPAPRPGIALALSDSGCSPLQVQVSRLWSDPIDSAHWQFGDGNVRTVLVNPATAVHTYNHTLSTQQKYLLKQRLFGSTGCITEDSMIISVLPGFENGYTPILDFASVNPDQSVSVSWHPHAHAAQYQVYKNNAPLALSVNANFTDPDYTAQAAYQVSAINVCAQPSPLSNIGKLMLLQGQNQNNQSALLQWTAYEDWSAASGILRYQLEVNQNGIFIPVAETNNRDFTDAEFIQSGQYERCYRVTAVQTANPSIQSHSNTACVGYEAVIFVPNAFSPNEDGLNDVFEPFNIGFKHYTLKVYNRWGEKIAEGRNWDGKIQGIPAPVGLYHFQIEGQTGKSENTFLKGEVMLVK